MSGGEVAVNTKYFRDILRLDHRNSINAKGNRPLQIVVSEKSRLHSATALSSFQTRLAYKFALQETGTRIH